MRMRRCLHAKCRASWSALVLLLVAETQALQIQVLTFDGLARRATPPRGRSPAPCCAKPLSRNLLDFANKDRTTSEFNLEANVLGLAPKLDSGVLLMLAVLVARSHTLPVVDIAFAAT